MWTNVMNEYLHAILNEKGAPPAFNLHVCLCVVLMSGDGRWRKGETSRTKQVLFFALFIHPCIRQLWTCALHTLSARCSNINLLVVEWIKVIPCGKNAKTGTEVLDVNRNKHQQSGKNRKCYSKQLHPTHAVFIYFYNNRNVNRRVAASALWVVIVSLCSNHHHLNEWLESCDNCDENDDGDEGKTRH